MTLCTWLGFICPADNFLLIVILAVALLKAKDAYHDLG